MAGDAAECCDKSGWKPRCDECGKRQAADIEQLGWGFRTAAATGASSLFWTAALARHLVEDSAATVETFVSEEIEARSIADGLMDFISQRPDLADQFVLPEEFRPDPGEVEGSLQSMLGTDQAIPARGSAGSRGREQLSGGHKYAHERDREYLLADDTETRLPGIPHRDSGRGGLCCCVLTLVKWSYSKLVGGNPTGGGLFAADLRIRAEWEWKAAPLFAKCTMQWLERTNRGYYVPNGDPNGTWVPPGPEGRMGPWTDVTRHVTQGPGGWHQKMDSKRPDDCPRLIGTSDFVNWRDTPAAKPPRQQQIIVRFWSGCAKSGAGRNVELPTFSQTIHSGPPPRQELDPDHGTPGSTRQVPPWPR